MHAFIINDNFYQTLLTLSLHRHVLIGKFDALWQFLFAGVN
jgi:hypothetical protein